MSIALAFSLFYRIGMLLSQGWGYQEIMNDICRKYPNLKYQSLDELTDEISRVVSFQ